MASWLQRPPTSMASTTGLQRCMEDFGARAFLARLASWIFFPLLFEPQKSLSLGLLLRPSGLPCRGVHSPEGKRDTKVVSMASGMPSEGGSPLAMTSLLRTSCRWTLSMFHSMNRVFVVTRAPASWQTLATIFSSRNIPAWAQAERWSPKGSTMRRHRQRRAERGNAGRRRLKSRITHTSIRPAAMHRAIKKGCYHNDVDNQNLPSIIPACSTAKIPPYLFNDGMPAVREALDAFIAELE